MNKKEVVYLVLTDAVGSSELDNKLDPTEWRKYAFKNQLRCLLSTNSNSLALKSVGDALFVIYEVNGNKSKEDKIVKEILYCVWEAFESTKNDNIFKIPIRCAIHRITDHKKGDGIARDLESLQTSGDKSQLVEALKKDIFGKEVNRAVRILSLVHNPAILVSEAIVNMINPNANKKALDFKPIEFKHNNQRLIFHSPVPVLYMKGVFNLDDQKNQEPYVVWELGKKEEPTLMPEFKRNQALRLITVRLKGPRSLSKELNYIATNTLENLSLQNPDLKLRFYIDIIWKVKDYFILRDPSLERIDRKIIDKQDYLKSLENLISTEKRDGNLQKDGQVKKLNIDAKKTGISKIIYKDAVAEKEFVIPLLAFTTFPDFEHRKKTRSLLSKEKLTNSLISEIQPESIEIFGNIKIDNDLINKKGRNILLLFQVFSDYIKDADNLKILFKDVEEITSLKVVCYGLTTGFTDGFVLYTSQSNGNKWEDGIKSILKKIIGVTTGRSFYHKIYPIGVFILEQVSKFSSLERNIQCLKQLSEKRDDL